MTKMKFFLVINLLLMAFSITSCQRNSNDVWEDTKSASRHVNRGFKSLGGKHGDSRAVKSREDFMYMDDNGGNFGGQYIPLRDYDAGNEIAMADVITRQPRENPGDPGSSVPGIEAFKDPSTISGMSTIFRPIQFAYNSSLVKGDESLNTIQKISTYLKSHPNTYVFVEGHCDERGPEAYNLALGSRRSNAVRNMLIEQGVNSDNIFTISYGKERPIVMEHHEEAWNQNRRAEFKIYQR